MNPQALCINHLTGGAPRSHALQQHGPVQILSEQALCGVRLRKYLTCLVEFQDPDIADIRPDVDRRPLPFELFGKDVTAHDGETLK